jgi:hypothetical protein
MRIMVVLVVGCALAACESEEQKLERLQMDEALVSLMVLRLERKLEDSLAAVLGPGYSNAGLETKIAVVERSNPQLKASTDALGNLQTLPDSVRDTVPVASRPKFMGATQDSLHQARTMQQLAERRLNSFMKGR